MTFRTYENLKTLLLHHRGKVADRYFEITAAELPKLKTATMSLLPKIDAAIGELERLK
jgi:hypothetical protein